MKRYGSIYLATNKHTGEQYVGQTSKSVAARWYAHKISALKPKFAFARALAGHGFDNFHCSEVYTAFDKAALDAAEREIITCVNPVYNMTRGGAGNPARSISASTRLKRSVAAKERWANPEWRAKTTASIKTASGTPEARERMRQAMSKYNGGALRWAGHVKKVKPIFDRSALTTAQWTDPQIRARRVAGLKKALSTPEARANMSRAGLGRAMPLEAVEKSRVAKFKQVTCVELGVSFVSMQAAADYLAVCKSTITEAIKHARQIGKRYTIIRSAYAV